MSRLYLCLLLFYNCRVVTLKGVSSKIAVVEYAPITNGSDDSDTTLSNFNEYKNILAEIKEKKVDLVVFPEATLNKKITAIEITVGKICYEEPQCSDELLTSFSSAVTSTKSYVVINLTEKEKCEESDHSKNCKEFGYHYYNTDVAFDRTGKIINKYRKYNLFGEYDMDQPEIPEKVVIETDFTLKLGIFTCFDILFKSPAQDLVREVDGVIFPSMWFSELPFLTSLQTQQMWAHAHDKIFFAAGANAPIVGSGGSGVYQGSSGALSHGILAKRGNKIFYSDDEQVDENTDKLGKEMDGFYLKTDRSVIGFKSETLNTSRPITEMKICYENGTTNGICCNFSIKISTIEPNPDMEMYTYHLVAYSGVRSFDGVYNGGTEICGLIACLNSSLSSCGHRFTNYNEIDWPVTFESIEIKANFEKSENRTQYPNSLLSSIRPITASKTEWLSTDKEENLIERTFSLKEKQNRLLTFAIYGRIFENDYPPKKNDCSNRYTGPLLMLITLFVVVFNY